MLETFIFSMKTNRGIIPHIKGLPHPQKLRGKLIVSTEDDDRVAVNFIHNQNVYVDAKLPEGINNFHIL